MRQFKYYLISSATSGAGIQCLAKSTNEKHYYVLAWKLMQKDDHWYFISNPETQIAHILDQIMNRPNRIIKKVSKEEALIHLL